MPNQYTNRDRVAHFWARVDQSGGPDACWPWRGTCTPNGYGLLFWQGSTRRAHRVAYTLVVGPIPDGLDVLHDCPNGDMPACCNPAHHWIGTHAANNADRDRKGRQRTPTGTANGAHTHPETVRRGAAHHAALLDDVAVRSILARAAREPHGCLAAEFGVSRATVGDIYHRRTWRHLLDGDVLTVEVS